MLLILISTLNVLVCHAQKNDKKCNADVDEFVKRKMKELAIPGMAVAVVRNGQTIKVATYGVANIEWNTKVTRHTNFQLASSTKLLTSTLLLKAVYEGKIKLDDAVSTYLNDSPAIWQKLRIKHLISHSSGIRNFDGDPYAATAAVVTALKDSTLEYEPGQGQHYAQFDFMLLGYILEKIYQKPFPQLVHDEVTAPLGMRDGAFDMEIKTGGFMRTECILEKATTYYDLNGRMMAYKFIYPQYTYTAGGYFASIDDMASWAVGLDRDVLFPAGFAQPLIYGQDSIGAKKSEFSRAGWALETENGITYAGHSGGPGLGDVWRFPARGYTFIVLANDGELLPGFARAIASFYLKELPAKTGIRKFER
ncbi:class A beta-lactamase-related serine hydrolase [Hymenobacter rubripertinctus]|uniref:Class A beta-lactamase-related serine hydrolase n=1 Tax=Hymenobacter rubripertinctus TaxID=2029981 RepID=A0A418QUM2_9BACT|nr:class A beta-lactamase-related serine hydrolase [Hymenobacter rubripertinctus]